MASSFLTKRRFEGFNRSSDLSNPFMVCVRSAARHWASNNVALVQVELKARRILVGVALDGNQHGMSNIRRKHHGRHHHHKSSHHQTDTAMAALEVCLALCLC